MNENESQIRELLGEGIGEEPPIVGGPAAVFAGARRHAVRTRAIAGALSAVAVLGVAAGVAAVSAGAGKPGASTVAPGVVGTPARQVPIEGRSAAETLKLVMPAGFTTAGYGGMDSDAQSSTVVGVMSVDDGTGKPTQLIVSVGRRGPEAISGQACDDMYHKDLAGVSGCQAHMQPDGSVVLVYRMDDRHRSADGRALDAYRIIVERLSPNGIHIMLSAANWSAPLSDSPQQSMTIGPSRQAPPLSSDQLATMVMDPRWGLTVSAGFAQQAENDITPYLEQWQKH